jgi:hypothetical protein
MVAGAFLLDPVCIFVYTWQSLPILELEEKNWLISRVYKYYRRITIWIVPAAFFGLFGGVVYANGK